MPEPSSFADIAVAMQLASSQLQSNMVKTKMIAERIGLSEMGYATILPGLELDAARVIEGTELFKRMADVEPEIRALLAHKRLHGWIYSLGVVVGL